MIADAIRGWWLAVGASDAYPLRFDDHHGSFEIGEVVGVKETVDETIDTGSWLQDAARQCPDGFLADSF